MGDQEHVFGRGLALVYLGVVITLAAIAPSLGVYRTLILLIGISLLFWGSMSLLSTRGGPRMDMQLSIQQMSRMIVPFAGFVIVGSSLLFGLVLLFAPAEGGIGHDLPLPPTHLWFAFFALGLVLVGAWLFARSARHRERVALAVAGGAVLALFGMLLSIY